MSKEVKEIKEKYNGIIPAHLRGVIKGTTQTKRDPLNRKGGEQTNAAYAKENNITKRQASKQRKI
jgi:hypothetical protein